MSGRELIKKILECKDLDMPVNVYVSYKNEDIDHDEEYAIDDFVDIQEVEERAVEILIRLRGLT